MVMVTNPPIDLEEVVQAVGPQGRSQGHKGNLGMVLSVTCGPLVRRRARLMAAIPLEPTPHTCSLPRHPVQSVGKLPLWVHWYRQEPTEPL